MLQSKSLLCLVSLVTFTSFSYADIAYTDTDFSSPRGSITSDTSTGNITITTGSSTNPQINNPSGFALQALDGTSLTVNNASDFNINGNWGIRVANNSGASSTLSLNGPGDLIITSNQRGIFVTNTSTLNSNSKISINSDMAGIWADESGKTSFPAFIIKFPCI